MRVLAALSVIDRLVQGIACQVVSVCFDSVCCRQKGHPTCKQFYSSNLPTFCLGRDPVNIVSAFRVRSVLPDLIMLKQNLEV